MRQLPLSIPFPSRVADTGGEVLRERGHRMARKPRTTSVQIGQGHVGQGQCSFVRARPPQQASPAMTCSAWLPAPQRITIQRDCYAVHSGACRRGLRQVKQIIRDRRPASPHLQVKRASGGRANSGAWRTSVASSPIGVALSSMPLSPLTTGRTIQASAAVTSGSPARPAVRSSPAMIMGLKH